MTQYLSHGTMNIVPCLRQLSLVIHDIDTRTYKTPNKIESRGLVAELFGLDLFQIEVIKYTVKTCYMFVWLAYVGLNLRCH